MSREYNFWVYIVTNRNHSVLYIYYEYYRDIRDAIARETQLKKWSRTEKVALIGRVNPSWLDLGVEVLQDR